MPEHHKFQLLVEDAEAHHKHGAETKTIKETLLLDFSLARSNTSKWKLVFPDLDRLKRRLICALLLFVIITDIVTDGMEKI